MKNITFIFLIIIQAVVAECQWKQDTVPTTGVRFNGISFVNTYIGYAVGQINATGDGVIINTTNGGKTWVQQIVLGNKPLFGVKFVNKNKGWAVGFAGTIISTTDGGNSWENQVSGSDHILKGVSFLNDSVGYVCAWNVGTQTGSEILKTSDGGKTWKSPALVSHGIWPTNVKAISNDTAFLTSLSGIWKTTDGGVTWLLKGANDEFLYSVDFYNHSIGIAVGNNGLFYTTTNGGETWVSFILDPSRVTLNDISLTEGFYGCIVGGSGTIETLRPPSSYDKWLWVTTQNMLGTSFINKGRGWACGDGNSLFEYFGPGFNITCPSAVNLSTGTTFTDTTITITNSGDSLLHVSLTLNDSVFYILSPISPFTLAKGSSQAVVIRFAPQGCGKKNAELIIESEAPVEFVDLQGSITAPKASVLISPLNNSTGLLADSVTLTWGASNKATSYSVQVATDVSFSSLVTNSPGIQSPFLLLPALNYDTKYYWRVNAVNSCGDAGIWSSVWNFKTSTAASVNEDRSEVAHDLVLLQNYPNPFSQSTTIPFRSKGVFEVRDMLGRLMYKASIDNTTNQVQLDAQDLSPGMYFYSLTDAMKIYSRRMMVVK